MTDFHDTPKYMPKAVPETDPDSVEALTKEIGDLRDQVAYLAQAVRVNAETHEAVVDVMLADIKIGQERAHRYYQKLQTPIRSLLKNRLQEALAKLGFLDAPRD